MSKPTSLVARERKCLVVKPEVMVSSSDESPLLTGKTTGLVRGTVSVHKANPGQGELI